MKPDGLADLPVLRTTSWRGPTRSARLKVRTNADQPDQAATRRVRREGIGLCRTEHMFFGGERIDYVSCSPFRLPVARLAAAQAAIEERGALELEK